LATGRILQFDQSRGYGFVAAEDGGEDIFLHASVFHGDSDLLVSGTRVEFQIMAGDRGRKAYDAGLAEEESATREPAPAARPVPGPPLPALVTRVLPQEDEDQMCDVLSAAELRQEITELLLNAVPELTGQQIVQARQGLLEFAKEHGWSDG
jgi:cold shock protein